MSIHIAIQTLKHLNQNKNSCYSTVAVSLHSQSGWCFEFVFWMYWVWGTCLYLTFIRSVTAWRQKSWYKDIQFVRNHTSSLSDIEKIDLLLNFTMAMTYMWLQQNYGSVQVYSNTRVPTQVNTSQHESDASQHESDTSQHESDTSQHESTQVKKCPRWVNIGQHKPDTSLTQVNLS